MPSQSQLPTSSSSSRPATLEATYASNQNTPFTLTQQLTLPQTTPPTQQQKSAYLHDLRQSTSAFQEQINKELTQRMEEDKAGESTGVDGGSKSGGGKKKSAKIDDEAEEENYGEEVVEDSD